MEIRTAVPTDAPQMSFMLKQLVASGKRTSPADEAFIMRNYIEDPDRILCSVAIDDDGTLLGFQSLMWALDGNRFETPVGWGIIGTHVSPLAGRRGVGSSLFDVTKKAAYDAGLENIEAFIGSTNVEGQAYYEKMGFRTYRIAEGAICKCCRLQEFK
ncbi:GNAT family N-acetyltransferase [Lentilitoribacter sp. Alg239-R112]|jgi:ribosomal protein S18 acetylase RimI-like enzyme|uniref:GNAT family N-acetyltransferase n=1 Tax=Lentilitoribacter sp. Alg239-R112 TaxID=2305987 RepID=UPI0013A6C14B|nr:GNAT family N-acetyltransferase [Lentilitoribacter sp. Alg239-R112]